MNINSLIRNMIPRLNQNVRHKIESWNPSGYDPHSAAFWAWHPFVRGIGTGLTSCLFTNLETPFESGGILGIISGLYNIAIRTFVQQLEKSNTSQVNGLILLSVTVIPWAAAGMTMRILHIITGKPIFKIPTGAVFINGVCVSAFGYANKDLWTNKF